MKNSGAQCVVCSSGQGVTGLGVCEACTEFLADSVSEQSHLTMTCLQVRAGMMTGAMVT